TRAASKESVRETFDVDKDLIAVGMIKGNLFELDCPSETLSCELNVWAQKELWSWVRQKTEGTNFVAVPLRNKIYALGNADDLKDCFRDEIKGFVGRTPISERDLRYEDSAISHLMRVTIVRILASTRVSRQTGKGTCGSRRALVDARRMASNTRCMTRCPYHCDKLPDDNIYC